MQVDNYNDISAKPAHTEFSHEPFLLPGGSHAQETQSLTFADLAGHQYIKTNDRSKVRADGMQKWPQIGNIGAIL